MKTELSLPPDCDFLANTSRNSSSKESSSSLPSYRSGVLSQMVTYRVSKMINAPIKYVYDWATDFTEHDNSIWGGKYPKIILHKTRKNTIFAYYSKGADGKPKLAVRFVSLHPSTYSWHLDYYGEEALETGEYKLTRLGTKTRLNLIIKSKWKHGKGPSAKEFEKYANFVWMKYAEALEEDYRSGKSASS